MTTHVPLLAGIALLFVALLASSAVVNLESVSAPFTGSGTASASGSLSSRLPPGHVATSLRLGRVESVAGSIRVGDTIDVYAFFAERGEMPETRVILREKLVYAVSETADAVSVTLALPTDEAVAVQDALLAGARPYAVIRSARAAGGRRAPDAFGDAQLPSWITEGAPGR